jgi:SAM-dependent methyltransferase
MPARRIVDILLHPHYHRWDFWRSRCNICGHATVFLCTEGRERWIRFCLFCRSTPKYRALYHALTRYLGVGLGARLDNGASVYELTATSPIYRCFRRYAGYSRSVYMSDRPFGIEIKPRVWNLDVQRLTFPDASFDVVISSETMEHVRKPWIGFAEIHRVLKPGGVHCFMPHSPLWRRLADLASSFSSSIQAWC